MHQLTIASIWQHRFLHSPVFLFLDYINSLASKPLLYQLVVIYFSQRWAPLKHGIPFRVRCSSTFQFLHHWHKSHALFEECRSWPGDQHVNVRMTQPNLSHVLCFAHRLLWMVSHRPLLLNLIIPWNFSLAVELYMVLVYMLNHRLDRILVTSILMVRR